MAALRPQPWWEVTRVVVPCWGLCKERPPPQEGPSVPQLTRLWRRLKPQQLVLLLEQPEPL